MATPLRHDRPLSTPASVRTLLPIEQPREFQFVINRMTADTLGLTIPKSLEIQMTEPFL